MRYLCVRPHRGTRRTWDTIAVRVGADVYRYEIPYWYLAVWNTDTPWAFEPESGDWEEVGTFAREEDFLGVFAEHVGDNVWRGGKYM